MGVPRFPSRTAVGVLLLLVATGALGTAGCTAGSKAAAKADRVTQQLKEIHDRAYRCSPRKLALATAHVDFGRRELEQGDILRAQEHLEIAYKNAQEADAESRGEECLARQAALPADRDGDGIPDGTDRCPLEPEDADGFMDSDGCPDPDNDADTVLDPADRCPLQAGDPANAGCPVSDRDGDGVPDDRDACPDQPEDRDGFMDQDGCPDPDNDADTVIDPSDRCPNDPGDVANEGCPVVVVDRDGDGIVDASDRCPDEPETYNGYQDDDGCPDQQPYKLVVVTKEKIELKQKIHFAFGKAIILPESYPLLNEVAQVLLDMPKITVRIEGHTDSRGSDAFNLKLSDDRAKAVRTYLIRQGVAPERMEAIGFGEQRPIEDNATEEGRAANRRVEFFITSQ